MGALLDKMPELTAVFAMADVLAVGAIRAIRDRGLRVPEDISVIGFDGIDLGNYLTPRLTTIRQKSDRIADRSMEILVDRIEEEKKKQYMSWYLLTLLPERVWRRCPRRSNIRMLGDSEQEEQNG